MKTLIIGNKGNMGSRYAACLNYLGEGFDGIDLGEVSIHLSNRAIICTPTESHLSLMKKMNRAGINFLVEKPIATTSYYDVYMGVKDITVDARMVCNWEFAINMVLTGHRDTMVKGNTRVEYDCYNTGKDGVAWDCIQLIHLAGPKNISIKTKSPVMECKVYTEKNPKGYEITTRHIEESYVCMLSSWLNCPEQLWGMPEALQAHMEVLEYMELQK